MKDLTRRVGPARGGRPPPLTRARLLRKMDATEGGAMRDRDDDSGEWERPRRRKGSNRSRLIAIAAFTTVLILCVATIAVVMVRGTLGLYQSQIDARKQMEAAEVQAQAERRKQEEKLKEAEDWKELVRNARREQDLIDRREKEKREQGLIR